MRGLRTLTVLVTGITALLLMITPVRPVGERAHASAADPLSHADSPGSGRDTAAHVPPPGLQGIIRSMTRSHTEGSVINRLGTTCERVMVGQRAKTVKSKKPDFGIGKLMRRRASELSERAWQMAQTASLMSDEDYDNLLRIVEAEAGTEDLTGRILVANVILNRVMHEEFPDTVTDVIYQYEDGVAQFSPVADGRIYIVEVSELTRQAVREAMSGTDYSRGAIYFIHREFADLEGAAWFDQSLTPLFKHGVHEFYTEM